MKGQVVIVRGSDAAGHEIMKVYEVGLESGALAITAVRATHPELSGCRMQTDGRLSATAVAFLELQPGEVRERHAVSAGSLG